MRDNYWSGAALGFALCVLVIIGASGLRRHVEEKGGSNLMQTVRKYPQVIRKYPLKTSPVEIQMPRGSKFLCVHEQGGSPTVWFVEGCFVSVAVDIDESIDLEAIHKPKTVTFRMIMDEGKILADIGDYLGTAIVGPFAYHVYMKQE